MWFSMHQYRWHCKGLFHQLLIRFTVVLVYAMYYTHMHFPSILHVTGTFFQYMLADTRHIFVQ